MSNNGEKDVPPKWNYKFNIIPKTISPPYSELFDFKKKGLVKGEPGGFVMTPLYGAHAQEFYQFQPRKDDIWISTFPKCGTTWTAELVWLLANDCDFEGAMKSSQTMQRVHFLELTCQSSPSTSGADSGSHQEMKVIPATLDEMPSPRFLKTHLPFYLLNPSLLDTCKVVYVARNPKDAIVSFYFLHKLVKRWGYIGDVEQFAQYFMDDEIIYTPFFPHVLDAWSKRDHPNLLFLFYEDMKKDLRGEIEKVAKFLNKSPTEEQMAKLLEHLSFDAFSKNRSVNMEDSKKVGYLNEDGHFIRKGKTGDWKNHFSPELNEKVDAWINKNLAGTDLKFVTELEYQD